MKEFDETKDEQFAAHIRKALNASYDHEQLIVSEDLISRTMERIRAEAGENVLAREKRTEADENAFAGESRAEAGERTFAGEDRPEAEGKTQDRENRAREGENLYTESSRIEAGEGVRTEKSAVIENISDKRIPTRKRFFRIAAGLAAALFVAVLGISVVRSGLLSKKDVNDATANGIYSAKTAENSVTVSKEDSDDLKAEQPAMYAASADEAAQEPEILKDSKIAAVADGTAENYNVAMGAATAAAGDDDGQFDVAAAGMEEDIIDESETVVAVSENGGAEEAGAVGYAGTVGENGVVAAVGEDGVVAAVGAGEASGTVGKNGEAGEVGEIAVVGAGEADDTVGAVTADMSGKGAAADDTPIAPMDKTDSEDALQPESEERNADRWEMLATSYVPVYFSRIESVTVRDEIYEILSASGIPEISEVGKANGEAGNDADGAGPDADADGTEKQDDADNRTEKAEGDETDNLPGVPEGDGDNTPACRMRLVVDTDRGQQLISVYGGYYSIDDYEAPDDQTDTEEMVEIGEADAVETLKQVLIN